mgnify:CR=1 FL=1|jgi:hypothetical protein|tara:strand:+ start:1552 stop:1773 length:222 start_codon:yes stop_codon:yes gene_type:complete
MTKTIEELEAELTKAWTDYLEADLSVIWAKFLLVKTQFNETRTDARADARAKTLNAIDNLVNKIKELKEKEND